MSSGKTELRAGKKANYAAEAEFCQLFSGKLSRLYMLSLLLTCDPKRAEQCFVRSFEACLESRGVFKDWAERWATHTIIKEAIKMTLNGDAPGRADAPDLSEQSSDTEALVSGLRELASPDRFVYVMSVLEKYSDRECASFLGCASTDVREARERALRQLAKNDLLLPAEETMPLRMIS